MAPSEHGGLVPWICTTCGTQHQASIEQPPRCAICCDERQYVAWAGQQWTSPGKLREHHAIVFDTEEGVRTMRAEPSFGIGQRAFLVPHGRGHMMWECLSLVTEAAVEELERLGGVTGIAISHPHFYSSMVEWSEALGNVPIYLHAADQEWVQRPSNNLRFWEGDRMELPENLVLVRLGGHFPGSAGLWWKNGPRPGGSLFSGDAIQVVMDRRHATFMYSYPNAIPLPPAAVRELEERVADLAYDDVFGYSPGRQIIGDAKASIKASFERYLTAIGG